MKKVFFRTKGNQAQGWGNVLRQITLAKSLKKKYKIFFFVQSDSKLKNFLKSLPFKVNFLPENLSLAQEKKIINNFPNPNFTLIEMLYPKTTIQNFYKKITKEKVIVYDDILDGKYTSDYLISCQGIEKKIKKINKKCRIFNDLMFYPVNNELMRLSKKKKNIKKKINNISILLGGSYYGDIYYKIIKILKLNNFENIKIIASQKNFFKTKKKIKMINPKIKVYKNINNPGKFLQNSDLAIVGGGYTKVEAAIVNTPFISISMHKHQKNLIKNFNQKLKLPNFYIHKDNVIRDLEKYVYYFKNYHNRLFFIKKLRSFMPEGTAKLKKILN